MAPQQQTEIPPARVTTRLIPPPPPGEPQDVQPSTKENIFSGFGRFVSQRTGQKFEDSPLGAAVASHYQSRLHEAQMHHKQMSDYGAALWMIRNKNVNPETSEEFKSQEERDALEQKYESWYETERGAYEKAAGVSKETKGALAKGRVLLDHLLGRKGSGQGTGAATPAPTGQTPPPSAPGGAGTGAAPASTQAPTQAPQGLTPPPAGPPMAELNAPRLEQEMQNNREFQQWKRHQDVLHQHKTEEEQTKTFAERAERPYTVETLEGVLQWNPDNRTWTRIGGAKPKAGPHETEEDKYIAEYMEKHPKADRGEAIAAYKRLGKEGEIGTWQLAEDSEGKTILYNSKTGETRAAPEGLKPKGAHAKETADYEKNIAPAKAAQEYADDYLASGAFTGPGDEALMEKFFELAKPSAGFRMTKPQQDMLRQARSWTQGTKAQMWHAWHGTWFSDEQRQQIVQTMRDLAKAKMSVAPKGLTGPPSASNPLDDRIKAAAAAAKAP